MKTHKRFLIWIQINDHSRSWFLAGESDDWSHASSLAISCLDNSEVTEVLVAEFISLEFSGGKFISSHIQFIPQAEAAQIRPGVFLDEHSGMVSVDGKTRLLSSLEYLLLSLLYRRENEIVTKRDITLEVWHEEYIPHSKLDVRIEQLISRLRRKVESDPSKPKFIRTIRERGYLFNREGEH